MDALEKANSSKTIRELLKFEESQTITLSEIMLRYRRKTSRIKHKIPFNKEKYWFTALYMSGNFYKEWPF